MPEPMTATLLPWQLILSSCDAAEASAIHPVAALFQALSATRSPAARFSSTIALDMIT